MSTIDNRIVKMQFDNAKFEAGVAQSMSTLDKLKEKLSFKNAGKGLEELQTSINKTQFNKIESSLDSLEKRFSTIGIAGMEVVKRITNSALDGIKKVSDATLGQIKSGGWSRAMNLANAQFTVEGLKLDWTEMLKAINYGVQDTAYGLDAAAKAASSLAASGVAYKESVDGANDSLMHTSLRAISGVAAMSNSSYEDISRIFTTIAGQGRVMSEQLNQLASRGLNAAATLGEQLGYTEAEIRDFVSKGKIDFETFATAMDSAFGEHAKDANKTFTGALSNMRAALSRVGAIFATPIIDKTNTLFISITSKIKDVQKALQDVKDEDGKVVEKGFSTYFAEAWEAAIKFASTFIDSIDMSWFKTVADWMSDAAKKATDFFNFLTGVIESVTSEVEDGAKAISLAADEVNAALQIFFGGKFGNGAKRVNGLIKAGLDPKRVQTFINEYIKAGYDVEKMNVEFDNFTKDEISKYIKALQDNGFDFKKTGELVKKEEEKIGELGVQIQRTREKFVTGSGSVKKRGDGLGEQVSQLDEIAASAVNATDAAGDLSDALSDLDPEEKATLTVLNIWSGLGDLATAFGNLAGAAKYSFDTVKNLIKDTFDPTGTAEGFASFASWVEDTTAKIEIFAHMFSIASSGVDPLTEGVDALGDSIERIGGMANYIKWQDRITKIYKAVSSTVVHIKNSLKNLWTAVTIIGSAIYRAFQKVFDPNAVATGVEKVGNSIEILSEMIVRFAELVAPVVETLSTIIFKIVKFLSGPNFILKPISQFIGKLLGVGSKTEDIEEGVRGIGQAAEESVGVFGKIGDILNKMITNLPDFIEFVWEKIQKIPDFLIRLRDALKDSEGVQRLKDAFENLSDIIGGKLYDVIHGTSDELDDLTRNGGQSKIDVFDVLVNVIDFLADKLAWVLEMLPVVGGAIWSFFGMVKDGATSAYDAVSGFFTNLFGKKDDIGPVGEWITPYKEKIADAFDPNQNRDVLDSAHSFGEGLLSAFTDGAGKINFFKIGGLVALFGLAKVLLGLGSITQRLKKIPSELGKIFESIRTMFSSFATSMKLFSAGQFIVSVTASIAAILTLVYLLSKVPEQDLQRAVGVVIILGVLMGGFIMMLSRLNDNKMPALLNSQRNVLSQKGLANFSASISGIVGVALMLIAVSSVLRTVTQSIQVFAELNKTDGAFLNGMAGLVGVLITLGGFVVGIMFAAKYLTTKTNGINRVVNQTAKTLAAVSLLVFSLSVSIGLISLALLVIPSIGKIGGKLATLGVILGALGVFCVAIMGFSKNANPKAITRVAILLAVAVAGLVAIVGLILTLGAIMAVLKAFNLDAFEEAAAAVGIILVTMGMLIWLATKNANGKNEKGIKAMTWLMVSVVAMIGVLGLVLYELSKIEGGLSGLAVGGVLGGIALVLVGIGAILWAMNKGHIKTDQVEVLSDVLLMFAIAVASVGLVIGGLSKINFWKLVGVVTALLVFFGAFAALGVYAGKSKSGDRIVLAISEIANALLVMGLAITAVGAGVLLLSMGLDVIIPVLPLLNKAFDSFLDILEDHWGIVLLITAAIVALAFAMSSLSKIVTPITDAIGAGLKKLFTNVADLGTTIIKKGGELLSKAGTKLGTWFKGLAPKGKGLVVGLIASVVSAVNEKGPAVLKSIGALILDGLQMLAGSIGPIVDNLVIILIKIIDGLANSILNHSGRIAASIWGVVGAIVGLVGSILEQGLVILLGPTIGGGIVKWLTGNGLSISNYMKENVARMQKEAEMMEDAWDPEKFEWDERKRLSAEDLRNEASKLLQDEGAKAFDESAQATVDAIMAGRNTVITDAMGNVVSDMRRDTSAIEVGHLQGKFLNATDLRSIGFSWSEHLGQWVDTTKQIGEMYEHGNGVIEYIGKRFDAAAGEAGMWITEFDKADLDNVLSRVDKFTVKTKENNVDESYQAGKDAANAMVDGYGEASETSMADIVNQGREQGIKIGKAKSDAHNEVIEDGLDKYGDMVDSAEKSVYGNSLDNLSDYKEIAQSMFDNKDINLILPTQLGGQGATLSQLKDWFGIDSYQQVMEMFDSNEGKKDYSIFDTFKNYLTGGDGGIDMTSMFADLKDQGVDNVDGLINTLSNTITGNGSIKLASAHTVKTGVTDVVKSNETKQQVYASWEEGVVKPSVNEVRGMKKPLYDAMGNAVLGLQDGFYDYSRSFKWAWEQFFRNLPKMVTDMYKIESPSKLFEGIMEYVVLGAARGITENEGVAIDAMSGMSTSIVDSFGNPLKTVAKIASGELQYDPSIRPVLDTSAIGVGANSINSMFDNQNVTLSGFSGQLAADIGEMEASNADIIAELQAMREEMAAMGEDIANMQVVMDSGALVGAIAPGMDNALGMRNIYRGRGN
jgi:tape measure domain-containing protein